VGTPPPPPPSFLVARHISTDINPPLAQLATIVRATGASVVLSSSWRQFPKAVLEIAAAMISHGLAPPIGSTPSLLIGNRASEIGAWLLQNQRRLGPTLRWVAIDDTGLKGLGSHFVKTRKWGLSEVNFKALIPKTATARGYFASSKDSIWPNRVVEGLHLYRERYFRELCLYLHEPILSPSLTSYLYPPTPPPSTATHPHRGPSTNATFVPQGDVCKAVSLLRTGQPAPRDYLTTGDSSSNSTASIGSADSSPESSLPKTGTSRREQDANHAGAALHTGASAVHAGASAVHAGASAAHAGASGVSVHTGAPAVDDWTLSSRQPSALQASPPSRPPRSPRVAPLVRPPRGRSRRKGNGSTHAADAVDPETVGPVPTGASDVHTGDPDVHTGASDVHTGASDVHTVASDVHTGAPDVHTGASDAHTGHGPFVEEGAVGLGGALGEEGPGGTKESAGKGGSVGVEGPVGQKELSPESAGKVKLTGATVRVQGGGVALVGSHAPAAGMEGPVGEEVAVVPSLEGVVELKPYYVVQDDPGTELPVLEPSGIAELKRVLSESSRATRLEDPATVRLLYV